MRPAHHTSWATWIILILVLLPPAPLITHSSAAERFLAIGAAVLSERNQLFVSGAGARPADWDATLPPRQSTDILKRRSFLAEHRVTYTRAHTQLLLDSLTRGESTATLFATEHTLLELAAWADPRAPSSTEYYQPYRFEFAQRAGRWLLSAYGPLYQPAPARSTAPQPALDLLPSEPRASATGQPYPSTAAPPLDRTATVSYAYQYWHSYNPRYRNFNRRDGLGAIAPTSSRRRSWPEAGTSSRAGTATTRPGGPTR